MATKSDTSGPSLLYKKAVFIFNSDFFSLSKEFMANQINFKTFSCWFQERSMQLLFQWNSIQIFQNVHLVPNFCICFTPDTSIASPKFLWILSALLKCLQKQVKAKVVREPLLLASFESFPSRFNVQNVKRLLWFNIRATWSLCTTCSAVRSSDVWCQWWETTWLQQRLAILGLFYPTWLIWWFYANLKERPKNVN